MEKLFSLSILILLFNFCYSNDSNKLECKFPSHIEDHPGFNILRKLSGKRYKAYDKSNNYEYYFGICTSAEKVAEEEYQTAGIIQVNVNKTSGSYMKKFIIGQYTNAAIKDGNNWALLEYNDGSQYRKHCGHDPRSASIMMLCNENEKVGLFHVLEENTNRTKGNCYYLFEFEHSAICHEKTSVSRPYYFSVGDILCVIFFCVVTLYLLIGVLFNGIIRQQRGLKMLPNICLWQDLGNLIADGCDFVFRSSNLNLPQSYREHPYQPAPAAPNNDQATGLMGELDSDSDRDEYLLRV